MIFVFFAALVGLLALAAALIAAFVVCGAYALGRTFVAWAAGSAGE